MLNWFKNIHNAVFVGFLVSIVLVFIYVRPLDSPWHRFINGDGLGYYSYLPAKYIYNDTDYNFKWFNSVYNANYLAGSFPNPEDNLLVEHQGKKINKYYQGLSYIWLPFFTIAHWYAKSSGYPADGFSLPYQVFIGFASLFYLFLGLIFLRKLLQKLFHNPLVYTVVPIALFYGTHLFTYALNYNSLSHVYSFAFIVLFIYCLVLYFNERTHRLTNLLFCFLFLIISIFVRPLNVIVLLTVPAFFPNGFFKERLRFEKIRIIDVLILIVTAGAIIHQFSISFAQSGSFFTYAYTGEKFYFNRSIFFDALISYRIGLFVYAPLLFLSFFGIGTLPSRRRVLLPVFFLLILYIYSSWWYWPIVKRAMVDYYVLPAIFLGALLNAFRTRKKKAIILSVVCLAIIFYQFKNMQINRGILSEFATSKELFWRNFFRTQHANIFPVDARSILSQTDITEGFESGRFSNNTSTEKVHSGDKALLVGSKNYICKIAECKFPASFNTEGFRKIRFSFWNYCQKGVGQIHVFIQFFDKENNLLKEIPFYMNEDSVFPETWDYNEFGVDLTDLRQLTGSTVDKVVFTIWNVDGRENIFIDDTKVEFMVTDETFETIK